MDQKYVISFIFLIIVIGLVISQLVITGDNPFESELETQELQGEQVVSSNPRNCQELCGSDNLCLDECYTGISNTASLTQDETRCNEIQDSVKKQSCIDDIKTSKSIDKNELSACENLNSQEKIFCQDRFYLTKAVKENNPSLCSQIQNEISKETCVNSIKWKLLTYTNQKR